MHRDGCELGDGGFQALPDPAGDVFAGGVFQPRHFVEQAVIELVFQGAELVLELCEIHQPAGAGVDRSADGDFHAEGVAMHAAALVSRGNVGQ